MIAVLCGGFCGTIARFFLSTFMQGWLGKGWPYDLLLINLTGALLLAFVTTLAGATFLVGPTWRLFINIGFLGAYTTFSSLALGDVLLFGGSEWIPGLLYLLLSIGGGLLAILLGDWVGQRCISKIRPPTPSPKFTRRLTETLPGLAVQGTIPLQPPDGQGDVGLPDMWDEYKTRQRRPGS